MVQNRRCHVRRSQRESLHHGPHQGTYQVQYVFPHLSTPIFSLLTLIPEGFQVAPAELEAYLIGRPDIADVCVIGVHNEEAATEVPRAYVVLTPGKDASDELAKEIAEWLNSRVAPPKKLRGGVRFIKEIPKSQAGKILRRVLREQVKKEEGKQPMPKL